MSWRKGKFTLKNSEKLSHELTVQKHLNAKKMLIKKLKERKKAYNEFLTQIDTFIGYAMDQAENSDNDSLKLKYMDAVEEEKSLRDKIRESLRKNDELIESMKKSSFNWEL